MLQTIRYPDQPSRRRLDAVSIRHLHLGQEVVLLLPQSAEEKGVLETAAGKRPRLCRHSPLCHQDRALEIRKGSHQEGDPHNIANRHRS